MTMGSPGAVTELLTAAGAGDSAAGEKLWSLVYEELHRIAAQQMAVERPGGTLQPTALIHEAYFRLVGRDGVHFSNRRHFFTSAANAMRRIRIDDARKRNSLKRGGHSSAVRPTDPPIVFEQDPTEVLAVDEAMEKLEQEAPRKAEVVLFRYFAGLTVEETASVMGLSRRTVQLDWRVARAWLHRALGEGETACRPPAER